MDDRLLYKNAWPSFKKKNRMIKNTRDLISPSSLTWMAGKTTMNEDVSPIKNCYFPMSCKFSGGEFHYCWFLWGNEGFHYSPTFFGRGRNLILPNRSAGTRGTLLARWLRWYPGRAMICPWVWDDENHPDVDTKVHPGRLTWNLQITHLERKMIFQTSMIMFHVNVQGCTVKFLFWSICWSILWRTVLTYAPVIWRNWIIYMLFQ